VSTAVPRHLRPLSPHGGALEADRALLGRTTAERVADVLRTRITEGFFSPGTRKLIECAVVRGIDSPPPGVERVVAAVAEGEPTRRHDWRRVETGDGLGAERLLAGYLDKAQEQLVGAYAQQTAAGE
jgi:hypothetical protein